MLNQLQSIAKEDRCELLDFPRTDPAQYISNHPGIERQSKQYQVDVSYPKTRLAYSRLAPRIQPSISSLSNEIQAHLRFDTAYIFDSMANLDKPLLITIMQLHSRHAFEPCLPTSHYPWVIHFAPFQAYFVPSWIRWFCACQHTSFRR